MDTRHNTDVSKNQPMPLRCLQLNMQHSRNATSNIVQIISEQNTDLIFMQEPYVINNQLVGLPKRFSIFTGGNGKKRSAIIANNNKMDIIAINQLNNADCVVVEVITNRHKFYAASIYMDIERDIGIDIKQIESILEHAKDFGVIIATDTNARSTTWFDNKTNQRGKKLEEFITTRNLLIINEDEGVPTFETRRAQSWIDLTISTPNLIHSILEWTSGGEESCSDHKLISFTIVENNEYRTLEKQEPNHYPRYIIKMKKTSTNSASGSMRACHAAGLGSIPGRDKFPG